MARKRKGIPGLSFSWKRATGISAAKTKIARATGIPTTKAGRKAKFGCSVAIAVCGASLGAMGWAAQHLLAG